MNNLNKAIAVIGEREIVKVFQAIGYACYYETDPTAIIKRCQQLEKDECKIILILENAAAQITSYLDSRAGIPYPMIIPIPDTITHDHYGMQRLTKNMEKAMGIKLGGN